MQVGQMILSMQVGQVILSMHVGQVILSLTPFFFTNCHNLANSGGPLKISLDSTVNSFYTAVANNHFLSCTHAK